MRPPLMCTLAARIPFGVTTRRARTIRSGALTQTGSPPYQTSGGTWGDAMAEWDNQCRSVSAQKRASRFADTLLR